jgi:hypothetical protein
MEFSFNKVSEFNKKINSPLADLTPKLLARPKPILVDERMYITLGKDDSKNSIDWSLESLSTTIISTSMSEVKW